MIKKLIKYGKIVMALILISALTLPSYATVGASDGSAFVTKAEFDAALSDFNARLTTFEAGINSKIDSQVSSYLDRNGIWQGKEQYFDTWDAVESGYPKRVSYSGVFEDKVQRLPHNLAWYIANGVTSIADQRTQFDSDGLWIYKINNWICAGTPLWSNSDDRSYYSASEINEHAVLGSRTLYNAADYGVSEFYQWAQLLTAVGPSFTATKSGMAIVNMNIASGSSIYHMKVLPGSGVSWMYGFVESVYWSDEFIYGDQQNIHKPGLSPTNVVSSIYNVNFIFRYNGTPGAAYVDAGDWIQYSNQYTNYFKDYAVTPEPGVGTIVTQANPNAFGSAPGNYVNPFFVEKGKIYQLHRSLTVLNNQWSIKAIELARGRSEAIKSMSIKVY